LCFVGYSKITPQLAIPGENTAQL